MHPEDKLWQWISILSVTGILLALYLLYNFLAPNPSDICSFSASVNCDPVTKGSLALFFGIPVALIGLIGYMSMLYGSIKRMIGLTLFMVTFGMLFCLRLTYLEIVVEHIVCPVCTACQIVMAVIFFLALTIFLRRRDKKA